MSTYKFSIFFNLVQKNSLIVEKFSKCRENGKDRLRKGNAQRRKALCITKNFLKHSNLNNSLTSGTPQKPNGCGNTDLFVTVTVRLTDSNTVQKPKSMSCTLNSISDEVTIALTVKGTGRV